MAEKFYITTSIPYVNSRPHLGHALEFVQADAVARWARLAGREVHFLSGADEHGAKIVRAAEASGQPVEKFVDANTDVFKKLTQELGISTSDFIRTSEERHFTGAQSLWKRLDEAGDIYKKSYRGLYCVGHEAFVTQKDLVGGKCADHGDEPEVVEEENYFFRLSKYGAQIQEAIESGRMRIYPEGRRNEILSFIKAGLEDVSFSRPSKDISWGVPVPGDASQTMYVWCDALSNYITALGYDGSKDWQKSQKFWPADLQVIGKDILRFHAAIWPGMLLSAGLELPKALLVHGFIHSGGQKMSKTLGNVVDPFEIIERHGADALRYYLLREIPTYEDGDFTEERFLRAYNSDLANGLGNYVSRVAKMIENYFGGVLHKSSGGVLEEVRLKEVWLLYNKAMERLELKSALDSVWAFLGELDNYVQQYEPFKLIKTDEEKTKAVLWNLGSGALTIAWMIEPFMPDTSEKIFQIFGVAKEGGKEWSEVKVNLKESLFPRKDRA